MEWMCKIALAVASGEGGWGGGAYVTGAFGTGAHAML